MQENNKNVIQNNDLPLDVYSIIRALLKDWWMIITAGLVGMLIAYIMAGTAYTPSYTSSMTFIVSSKGATSNVSDLTAANEMAETFGEVLNSRLLKKKVQQEHKGDVEHQFPDDCVKHCSLTVTHSLHGVRGAVIEKLCRCGQATDP